LNLITNKITSLIFFLKKKGYRDTQKALIEMADRTAEVDQIKGATLEEISHTVEQIGKEFKRMQSQLQPLIMELKVRITKTLLFIVFCIHLFKKYQKTNIYNYITKFIYFNI